MKYSAGILCYNDNNEIFMVSPGGPWECSIDTYSIPKAKVPDLNLSESELFQHALDSFEAKTGYHIDITEDTDIHDLGEASTAHKTNHIWLVHQPDAKLIKSSSSTTEWPKYSNNSIVYDVYIDGKFVTINDAEEHAFNGIKPFIRATRYILNS